MTRKRLWTENGEIVNWVDGLLMTEAASSRVATAAPAALHSCLDRPRDRMERKALSVLETTRKQWFPVDPRGSENVTKCAHPCRTLTVHSCSIFCMQKYWQYSSNWTTALPRSKATISSAAVFGALVAVALESGRQIKDVIEETAAAVCCLKWFQLVSAHFTPTFW